MASSQRSAALSAALLVGGLVLSASGAHGVTDVQAPCTLTRNLWRLDKADRSSKIDAVVALAMAVDRHAYKPEPVELLAWL